MSLLSRALALISPTRRITNRELSSEIRLAHERLRLALEAGKAVAWDWDVKSGRDIWFGDLKTMFGIPGDHYEGRVEDFHARVHPDDRQRVGQAVAAARRDRTMYGATFRVRWPDGTVRWAAAKGQFYYDAHGDPIRMLGIAEDVTELKRAEEARRETEARFQLMADGAPVLIWVSDPDRQRTYVNRPYLEFTGRALETELGSGWTGRVHPEDVKHCVMTYAQAFDQRRSLRVEYRLRRHDGVYRWLLDTGVPRLAPDGAFAGYIGSCVDMTEEKLAKEALSRLSRRLMESQESERIGLARALHDDLAQRMALMTIELETLSQVLPGPSQSDDVQTRFRALSNHAVGLGRDIQALSQRLHSFKLEYLGIAAAVEGFCRDTSRRERVEIECKSSGIADDLPRDVGLCLLRVLEEALANAIRHAGVGHFKVLLRVTRDEIQLEISDRGVGFDLNDGMSRHGLGLTSMRERLRLVDGRMAVESKPGAGTTVRARVPLRPADRDVVLH